MLTSLRFLLNRQSRSAIFVVALSVAWLIPSTARATILADSVIDFSGAQGLAGWNYGQLPAGAGGVLDLMTVYTTATHFGADVDFRWHFTGFPAEVTWWNTGGHTSTGNTFFAARRYTAPETGTINISGLYSKRSSTSGDGVVFDVRRNGVSLGGGLPTTYNSLTNATFSYSNVAVTAGDRIDLAIQRNGEPSFDAVNFQTLIHSTSHTVVARSFQEFSGTQGQDGWRYGRSTVALGSYSYLTDFTLLSPFTPGSEHFGFGDNKWTGGVNAGLYEEGGHPDDVSRPVIRRWTSDVSGALLIEGILADLDGGGGNGILGTILKNGVSIYSQAVANNNLAGFAYSVTTNIAVGDQLDFIIDANGDIGFDNTRFTAIMALEDVVVPEPSTFALGALGLAGLGLSVVVFRQR